MTALEVKEDGQIWLWPDRPVEPKYTDYVQHTKYHWQVNRFERAKIDYKKALASAPRYLVSNQALAETLIFASHPQAGVYKKQVRKRVLTEGIYPVDLKWKIMYDSPLGLIEDSPYTTDKKVAIISLPESKEKQKDF